MGLARLDQGVPYSVPPRFGRDRKEAKLDLVLSTQFGKRRSRRADRDRAHDALVYLGNQQDREVEASASVRQHCPVALMGIVIKLTGGQVALNADVTSGVEISNFCRSDNNPRGHRVTMARCNSALSEWCLAGEVFEDDTGLRRLDIGVG